MRSGWISNSPCISVIARMLGLSRGPSKLVCACMQGGVGAIRRITDEEAPEASDMQTRH